MFDSRRSIHHTAYIGGPPEDRTWNEGDEMFPPWIAASARIEAFVSVDSGATRTTRVDGGTWLMKHVHIGHDARVGFDCEFAPGVVICGFAEVRNGVKIGVNACVLPYVVIGEGARIGAGAVVTENVPPGETWAGNPARNLHPVCV